MSWKIGTNKDLIDSNTADIDATRNLPTTALTTTTWAVNAGGLRAYQTNVVSTDATAKTLTVSNVHATSGIIEIGLIMVMTTACAVTFTATTFVDGAPTFESGQTWAIALTSFDNGTSYKGKYTRLV